MSEHVVPVRTYLLVFAALFILTITTYYAATIDMEKMFSTHFPLNSLVALAIAVTKAVLVILYFMDIRDASRLTRLVLVSGFAWFAIMVLFTMCDVLTRT